VRWSGRPLGSLGVAAAFSTQSDKVINSGEGGFATTNDDEIAAKLIYLGGCYEQKPARRSVSRVEESGRLERGQIRIVRPAQAQIRQARVAAARRAL